MTTATADEQVLDTSGPGALALVADPEVDSQVATARKFPRSITSFMRRAKEMATLTPEIAASCIYALPRKENGVQKNIEGPSARLAEICASAWGNLRAEGRVIGHDGEYVTARGTAWDVESNVAIAYEAKRRITDRQGRVFSADMIGVTGNAGASIALRNAIFKVIPTTFWKPIYAECRKVVAGDAKTFASRRDHMLHEFAIMGVTAERLFTAIGIKGKDDITTDHMVVLAGTFNALKEGETTIEEAFPDSGGLGAPQPAQRKSQQPSAGPSAGPSDAAPATRSAEPATSVPTPASPVPVGVIALLEERRNGWLVRLDSGFEAATKDEEIVRGLQMAKDGGLRVELVTKAPRDPKYMHVVTAVKVIADAGAQA